MYVQTLYLDLCVIYVLKAQIHYISSSGVSLDMVVDQVISRIIIGGGNNEVWNDHL